MGKQTNPATFDKCNATKYDVTDVYAKLPKRAIFDVLFDVMRERSNDSAAVAGARTLNDDEVLLSIWNRAKAYRDGFQGWKD